MWKPTEKGLSQPADRKETIPDLSASMLICAADEGGGMGGIMDIGNLDVSPELREKAKACKTPEELLALAKSEGYKLSDAEMEAMSGGAWLSCPTLSEGPFRA